MAVDAVMWWAGKIPVLFTILFCVAIGVAI
jgi:hypothetical protein